jgi:hypothetical protein
LFCCGHSLFCFAAVILPIDYQPPAADIVDGRSAAQNLLQLGTCKRSHCSAPCE